MTIPFSRDYSDVYDLLYRDKDYEQEANYVAGLLNQHSPKCASIVEFGSGTGRHARVLEKHGFSIIGVDRSEDMVAHARSVPNSDIIYKTGDMRTVKLEKSFDAAIALFHVVSYLSNNEDIMTAFRNVRSSINTGGIFIFDFWYGPAVLTCRPESRLKEAKKEDLEVIRFAKTILNINKNLAEVSYKLHIFRNSSSVAVRMDELHIMRYFFLPELELMLSREGFTLIDNHEWMTRNELSERTWNGCIVARAI